MEHVAAENPNSINSDCQIFNKDKHVHAAVFSLTLASKSNEPAYMAMKILNCWLTRTWEKVNVSMKNPAAPHLITKCKTCSTSYLWSMRERLQSTALTPDRGFLKSSSLSKGSAPSGSEPQDSWLPDSCWPHQQGPGAPTTHKPVTRRTNKLYLLLTVQFHKKFC